MEPLEVAARLDDLVAGWAALTPSAPALLGPEGTRTFAELESDVARLGGAVSGCTEVGDRVAVLADNRFDFAALLYAVPATRRVLVPLNTRHAVPELVDQLERSGAALLLGDDAHLRALVPSLPPTLAGRLAVRSLDDPAGAAPGDGPAPTPPAPRAGADADDDPAWIVFTSGTTGRPKGAVLTHAGLLAAVRATARGRPLADDDVYLYPFPLFHVSAYNVLHAHARGRPVVLLPRFDASEVAARTAQHGVTAMSLAPTMLRLLLDELAADDDRLATLRTIAYGAAPMPPTLLREAVERLGVDVAQGFGMTELSGNAVFLSPDDHRAGLAGDARLLRAAGRAAPGVELRVVDRTGADTPSGEPGEVVVRAAQVFAGYWDDPDATAAALVDGWLHTGDVGVLDADGLLTIVDRAKDVVVTGGENVASREVEHAAESHPAVAQVAVIGLPDDRWGEAVTAVVVPRVGAGAEELAGLTESLPAHVALTLAGYKKPRRVILVEALPVNAGGKVDKRALRARFS